MRATGGMVWRYSGGCRDEAYNESIIRDDNDDEFQGWPEPVGREHKNKFNQVQTHEIKHHSASPFRRHIIITYVTKDINSSLTVLKITSIQEGCELSGLHRPCHTG